MNTQYWEEEIETMSREKLQELQLQRLKKTINIAANAPYYKEVFSKHNITADNIQSLDDIRKIPFTTKADMRANYPFGLVAGDMQNDGVRIHSSSGTTGNPTVIVHSQHDLDSWANLVARCLYTVGIRKTDVFQNSSGYGMFTGGLGFQYGAERLGCLTVPAAAGNSKRQIKFINDFKTTALHAIPSYAIRLAEVFQEEGLDPKGTTLKTLVIGAEPHTDEQRRKIERMLGQRYKLDAETLALPPYELLEAIGRKRGLLVRGGEVNTERCAIMLVDEFRACKWGRISLERPPQRDDLTDFAGEDEE